MDVKTKRSEQQTMEALGCFVRESRLCPCAQSEENRPQVSVETQATVWKQVQDYPGYVICQHGVVLSTKGKKIRALKTFYNKKTKVMTVSLGSKTKSLAKLVLKHFDDNYHLQGGIPRFKNMDHRDVSLSNLTYETSGKNEECAYWESYHKVKWNSPKRVPEHIAKAFFSYVLENSSVTSFCEELNRGPLPTKEELEGLLEEGFTGKRDLKKYRDKGVPLDLTKYILDCLSGVADCNKKKRPTPLLSTHSEVMDVSEKEVAHPHGTETAVDLSSPPASNKVSKGDDWELETPTLTCSVTSEAFSVPKRQKRT